MGSLPDLVVSTKREQLDLLKDVMAASESDLADEDLNVTDDISQVPESKRKATVRRQGRVSALSGADNLAYMEISRGGGTAKVTASIKKR
jgi:hypothetical protein